MQNQFDINLVWALYVNAVHDMGVSLLGWVSQAKYECRIVAL